MLYGVRKTIEKMGHDCMIVQNPLDAIEKALDYQPNLILINLLMPEMNGIQLCGKMNKTESLKNIPKYICSVGYGHSPEEEMKMYAKRRGAVDFHNSLLTEDILKKWIDLL